MAVLNASDMEHEKRNTFMATAATVCVITAFCLISGRISGYENYQRREDYWHNLEGCLDSVPKDGSVIANTWFLPHIADRDEVYIFDRNDFITDPNIQSDVFAETVIGLKDIQRYDFYVMSNGDENTAIALPYLEEAGFTFYTGTENYIVIYVSPEYLANHPN